MKNYLSAAKELDELMVELIGRKIEIPLHVVNDLKAGRSFASILLLQGDDAEVSTKAMASLQNVEMNLLSLAESGVSSQYADVWQKRINAAYEEEARHSPHSTGAKFVSGVPKGKHWVRIQAAELGAVQGLQKKLESHSLDSGVQDDGYLLIHGRKEDVTAFLKEVRDEIGKMGVKCNE